jgi:murein DD-endopeptidase MepM/ murein hydrolase activator NlpD
MRKININLPKHRLVVNLNMVKRRRTPLLEPIIPTTEIVNKKYRKGSFLGKFFRHVFEHKNIKKALATNFAILSMATSLVPQGIDVQAQAPVASPTTVIGTQVVLSTERGIQYPTSTVRITQRYHIFHPGLDLDGLTGDSIKPIKPGRVVAIERSKFAYGNSVIIDHGNQVTSLYAHLSKIEVVEGQDVTMNTEIGKMGATGRSFGDHLHLEVRDHGKAINPLSVLPR